MLLDAKSDDHYQQMECYLDVKLNCHEILNG